jgi:hypothetical protein
MDITKNHPNLVFDLPPLSYPGGNQGCMRTLFIDTLDLCLSYE